MRRFAGVMLAGALIAGCGQSSGASDGGAGAGGGGGGNAGAGGGGGGGAAGGGGGGGGSSNGSCPTIFPTDNAWNTDISAAPVDAMSSTYLTSIGMGTGMHPDFDAIGDGVPYVEVPANQAKVPITFGVSATESDPGPYPIPDNAPVEKGSDQHVIAVDRGNCMLYELYHGKKTSSGWSADSGAKWDLTSNAGRHPGWTSADAAGLPIFPGLVRYDEVMAGQINHALRFTVSSSQAGYVAPASHFASSNTSASLPPMGLRVRLKASVNISTYPATVQVILTALKKYGMIVADNGSDWFISGQPDTRWNDSDMATIKGIKGSDFEVIQHGPITQ